MGVVSEILFAKKYITKEEWSDFIKIISDYNGFFFSWNIIVTIHQSQVRYYIKSRRSLPTTINNLPMFLFKQTDEVLLPKPNITLVTCTKLKDNLIDFINYSEIRKKGTLKFFEIYFRKLSNNNVYSSTYFYLNKNDFIKKYKVLFSIPSNLLSVNFDGNKRFFYKGIPKYLDINKILHLLNTDTNNALLKIDTFPFLQGDFYFTQNSFHFDKHSIILGASGCGKSKFISLLINNIYKSNHLKLRYKIVVIDPHAALEGDIGGLGRVIDFRHELDSINLFVNDNQDIVSSTELLLDLFKSLMKEQYNSKLERVLRHTIYLLLTNSSFHFLNLRKVLLDLEFRNNLIRKLKYQLPVSVIDFFFSDFNELKTKSYGEAISPIIGFIDEMEMIPVFNETSVNDNLKETIQDNFLTIFSLDRVKLGDKVTKAISGLIMQQLLTVVQQRKIDEHIIFVIDEFAIVENPILCRYLSESRKYNLSLVLIGQYFSQISEELKNAIFANVFNYFIFRVSMQDAITLVDNFNMSIPLDNTKEKKINLLTELNARECVARITSNDLLLPAFKAKTLDFQSIPRKKVIRENVKKNLDAKLPQSHKFQVNQNISLKNILITTSSSRKVIKDE